MTYHSKIFFVVAAKMFLRYVFTWHTNRICVIETINDSYSKWTFYFGRVMNSGHSGFFISDQSQNLFILGSIVCKLIRVVLPYIVLNYLHGSLCRSMLPSKQNFRSQVVNLEKRFWSQVVKKRESVVKFSKLLLILFCCACWVLHVKQFNK